MKALKEFTLPISGYKSGMYSFEYKVGNDFFVHFEDSPVRQASLDVRVELERKPSTLVFEMSVEGWVRAVCDRCLADIKLPVQGDMPLVVKMGEEDKEEGDIVYIVSETTSFNIAKYIYELVCLSIPMTKIYDCEDEQELPCDLTILQKLGDIRVEKDEGEEGSPWNILKNIDLN